ncbi:hypothetical protein [Azospirillum brasilense]|uniref:hypothetical protein n=1 Tax=Azospirillum brasilense TaxID=192 RepID=UPI0020003295|nr:hypothetical protein [Azospirillum brasilense]
MDSLIAPVFLDFMGKPAWVWLTFIGLVLALLAFDLGILSRRDREIGVKESLRLSAFYISVALLFGGWVWWSMGDTAAAQYYTGFSDPLISLGVTLTLIAGGVVVSLLKTRSEGKRLPAE